MDNLDQQRAAYVWSDTRRWSNEHQNLAKGTPAMIMQNGLMQTVAYLQEKSKAGEDLVSHITKWLKQKQFIGATSYTAVMSQLVIMDSNDYLVCTDEVMALLRWTRQLAGGNQ